MSLEYYDLHCPCCRNLLSGISVWHYLYDEIYCHFCFSKLYINCGINWALLDEFKYRDEKMDILLGNEVPMYVGLGISPYYLISIKIKGRRTKKYKKQFFNRDYKHIFRLFHKRAIYKYGSELEYFNCSVDFWKGDKYHSYKKITYL